MRSGRALLEVFEVVLGMPDVLVLRTFVAATEKKHNNAPRPREIAAIAGPPPDPQFLAPVADRFDAAKRSGRDNSQPRFDSPSRMLIFQAFEPLQERAPSVGSLVVADFKEH